MILPNVWDVVKSFLFFFFNFFAVVLVYQIFVVCDHTPSKGLLRLDGITHRCIFRHVYVQWGGELGREGSDMIMILTR